MENIWLSHMSVETETLTDTSWPLPMNIKTHGSFQAMVRNVPISPRCRFRPWLLGDKRVGIFGPQSPQLYFDLIRSELYHPYLTQIPGFFEASSPIAALVGGWNPSEKY